MAAVMTIIMITVLIATVITMLIALLVVALVVMAINGLDQGLRDQVDREGALDRARHSLNAAPAQRQVWLRA